MTILEHVRALKEHVTTITHTSQRPQLVRLYVIWDFPKLAEQAGVPCASIYDVAKAMGIHPPDSGRAWYQAEAALEAEFRSTLPNANAFTGDAFIDWVGKTAASHKDHKDPTHKLIDDIYDVACATLEGQDQSTVLRRRADRAEGNGDHPEAHNLRQLADCAEEEEEQDAFRRDMISLRESGSGSY